MKGSFRTFEAEKAAAHKAPSSSRISVALNHEPTFLALDSMLFGERGATAITKRGETRGLYPIAHAKAIAELKSREQGLTSADGTQGKPSAGCLTSDDEALVGFWFVLEEVAKEGFIERLLLFAVKLLGCSNCFLVVFKSERLGGGIGALCVGGKLLHHAAAGVEVEGGGGGGIGEAHAGKLERKGGQGPVRWLALKEFWEKDVDHGSLNGSKGQRGAFNHPLNKLPLHLKRLLHPTEGRLREALTSSGHAADLVGPLIGFGR